MPKKKTHAELDREIEAALNKRGRYMLVDVDTGKDMREADAFEIQQIQREGRTSLELGGGPGSGTRAKVYRVKLRLLGVHQPTRAERRDPTLPKGETFAAKDRHGKVVASSSSVAGAMHQADQLGKTASITVRGEYTSDGHHWGLGKGRIVASRENGRWLRG